MTNTSVPSFSDFVCLLQKFYDIKWSLRITKEWVVFKIDKIKNRRNKRKFLVCDGVRPHEIQTNISNYIFEKN